MKIWKRIEGDWYCPNCGTVFAVEAFTDNPAAQMCNDGDRVRCAVCRDEFGIATVSNGLVIVDWDREGGAS